MDQAIFAHRFLKVRTLQKERFKRATRIMKKQVLDVFYILPLLLHYNDPKLPGYRQDHVPFGIDCFTLNDFQKDYLKVHGIDPEKKVEAYHSIYALYAMGSTSSIAQGQNSDLDIWVCVRKGLPLEEMNLLAEKCKVVSSFCKVLGADVNLFVTAEDRFISGEHGTMDTEDCGSAQSLFLLDEFYRSCFRVCGRYIAWYMISVAEEQEDYNRYLKEFYEQDYIDHEAWFDFGSVAKSSPVEYFGSGLWLVYKGIDHPFKAVLKILLMEAYSGEYPKTMLLSQELKEEVYRQGSYSLRLDSYYLMYKKVARYLQVIGDTERLHLARLCFYLKVQKATENLNRSKTLNDNLRFLSLLSLKWGWSKAFLNLLVSKNRWQINNILNVQRLLVNSLLKSYRTLLRFSVIHGIEYAITSDDAGVLSRKIYAALDAYPGKVMQEYKDAGIFLEAENITFVHPSVNSICRDGWHIFNCAMDFPDILSVKTVNISERLTQSVTWATLNGIMTSRTRVFVSSKRANVTASKIEKLSTDVSRFIQDGVPHVSEDDLKKPRNIIKSMVVFNLENDITQKLMISESDLELGDSLSCGRQKMCLIGSVDVIIVNSWGEVSCYSYPDGEQGVVELLSSLVHTASARNFVYENTLQDKVRVVSYSSHHAELIRYDFESIIKGVFNCFNDYESNYVFTVGHNKYEAVSDDENNDISIIRFGQFKAADDNVTILSRFGMRPEYALQVPSTVERHATVGIMQYFFAKDNGVWNIYIVNERNEVKIYYGFKGSRAALVNSINRFYTSISDKKFESNKINFNLPQYFVLSNDLKSIHPFTISNN